MNSDLNDIGVELSLLELEVANVWLEMAAEQPTREISGSVAKARRALFTADMIMGRLTMKEPVRDAMTDARNHLWARLRLWETRAQRAARAAA